jgi:hypothetical protein
LTIFYILQYVSFFKYDFIEFKVFLS